MSSNQLTYGIWCQHVHNALFFGCLLFSFFPNTTAHHYLLMTEQFMYDIFNFELFIISRISYASNVHRFIASLSPTSQIWYSLINLTLNFPGLISFRPSYFNTSCPGWNLFSLRCLSCHALRLFCITSVAHCTDNRFSLSLFRLYNLSLRISMSRTMNSVGCYSLLSIAIFLILEPSLCIAEFFIKPFLFVSCANRTMCFPCCRNLSTNFVVCCIFFSFCAVRLPCTGQWDLSFFWVCTICSSPQLQS